MANLKLKKSILEVVDNQLKANDPPCTKEVYEKLLNAGYSKSEAKDKIGAIVLTEIYDILKQGKSFNEEKYKYSLEEMLQQSIDYEDSHHIETEWDQWDALVQNGYERIDNGKEAEGLSFWQDAWKVFLSIMEQMSKKYSLYDLMEEQDYDYPIDEWLQDYDMVLGNVDKFDERIVFCQKILEIFDWQEDDDSCFQCGIAESLFQKGMAAEAIDYYENWLKEDPQNVNGLMSFSWTLLKNGDEEKAYEILKEVTWGAPCDTDNSILFARAFELAESLGKEDERRWYKQQLDHFEKQIGLWPSPQEMFFNEPSAPKQEPIVKEKKIYPNDPCPCGSGRKYKKCCGKK